MNILILFSVKLNILFSIDKIKINYHEDIIKKYKIIDNIIDNVMKTVVQPLVKKDIQKSSILIFRQGSECTFVVRGCSTLNALYQLVAET